MLGFFFCLQWGRDNLGHVIFFVSASSLKNRWVCKKRPKTHLPWSGLPWHELGMFLGKGTLDQPPWGFVLQQHVLQTPVWREGSVGCGWALVHLQLDPSSWQIQPFLFRLLLASFRKLSISLSRSSSTSGGRNVFEMLWSGGLFPAPEEWSTEWQPSYSTSHILNGNRNWLCVHQALSLFL